MLEPYLVLDFTDHRGEIGPMLLGDLGADVIRIEPPGGSSARREQPLLAAEPQDLRSAQFLAFNRNKRSIVLDPSKAADRETLQAMLTQADIVFENHPHGGLAAYGVDFEQVADLNPQVVFVHLSDFGMDGPHAGFVGNDLVLAAMGGPVALQGVEDRAPVRLSVPQVWRHAGVEAAAAAMVALTRAHRTGNSQYVDLSAQAVMTWTMLNAAHAHAIQGADFQRCGAYMDNGVIRPKLVHKTADGYIIALQHARVLKGCLEWMIADGVADPGLREMDWEAFDLNLPDPANKPLNLAQATELLDAFVLKHSKQELFEFGLKHGISLAPANTLGELLELDHLRFREYWHSCETAAGGGIRTPGLWAKPTIDGLSIKRQAPALDQHGDEIRQQFAKPNKRTPATAEGDDELPFAGIKVADFSWVGVGPISAKYLADHGAHVVRVESETRPDVLRAGGPFKDKEPGWNRSHFYGNFNSSKQSLALDLKHPQALEIAKQLIAKSDVMIESFAPGAIERMGLDYATLREINPRLIMVSTCLMGQTGPASSLAGYGYHAGAIAGFYEVTGWPDLGPNGPWVAYTDTIAPRFISVLLAAALDHRRCTGEGCHLDVAQLEASLHFLGPELIDLQYSGYQASRMGNRHRFHAPQGCYPCAGEDRWCAIAVDTDTQWQALCNLLQREDLVELYPDHAARMAAHDELDDLLIAWTSKQDAYAVMRVLQDSGVPAGVVQRSSDLQADPQYAHRGFHAWYEHPEMGKIPYSGHQYRIQGYNNGPRGPSPCLGQHSFEVLSEYLEMADEDIAAAYASGAIN